MGNKIENPIEVGETQDFRRAKVLLSWRGMVAIWQYRDKQRKKWLPKIESSVSPLNKADAPVEFMEEMASAIQRISAQARKWLAEAEAQ